MKPYKYIDMVKKELADEQETIVKTIKINNSKYLRKIGEIDGKVSEVVSAGRTLQFEF